MIQKSLLDSIKNCSYEVFDLVNNLLCRLDAIELVNEQLQDEISRNSHKLIQHEIVIDIIRSRK